MNFKLTNIFKNKKKDPYTCCRHLFGGITFVFDSVRTCCSNKQGITFVENYKGGPIDIKKIEKLRRQTIKNAKNGILPINCHGCVELENKIWEDDYSVKEVYFLHWDHCNCGCVYCLQRSHGLFLLNKPQKSRYYDTLPIVKQLIKNNSISKDAHIELVGGDLAVLSESEELINLFLENGVGRFSFHSSCIDYSKALEKALQTVPADFDFSLDAGCRETYKKIKRTDSFDKVVENITRYANCDPSAPYKMIAKYILIDGLNDNIDEIEKWLNVISSIGIKNSKIDVNFTRFFPEFGHPNPKVPEHYYEIFDYYHKRIKELGINDCCWEFTQMVMKEGGTPKCYLENKD